jgi:uncharacterized protein
MLFKKLAGVVGKHKQQIGKIAIGSFIVTNLLAYVGVHVMTHTHLARQIGLSLPRPTSQRLPSDVGLKYATVRIPSGKDKWVEAWSIPAALSATSKGTVLLFPGHLSSKGKQLIPLAQVFHQLNYDCLLVDFRGVGGSSGDTTTLGATEAQDVAVAMQYIRQIHHERPIILYGLSMGSAAVLTAIANEKIAPDAIVLELPYARLIDAVRSRVSKNSHLPTFPISELLVFWGGIQHGFNGFAHNPIDYARQVKCPILILNGGLDPWTQQSEINELFANINSQKKLVTFDRAGHDLLISIDRNLWEQSIEGFLNTISSAN